MQTRLQAGARNADMLCRILPRDTPADATALTEEITYPECGAVVTFTGNIRLTEGGRELVALDYEHHETMAARELEKVLRAALNNFDVTRVACSHSTGRIAVGQASVAVAVAANHRQAAFDACQFIMHQLKQTVPIWKKPVYANECAEVASHG